MRRTFLVLVTSTLVGCTGSITSDQAELWNIKFGNRVPKSSPSQFVRAFDKFCVEPESPSAREKLLRKASFIPTKPKRPDKPQVYFVDDRRPAIVISGTLCSARALSRTGQTQRLRSYIETKFRIVRSLQPSSVGPEVEQLWQIDGPARVLIATERGQTIDGLTTFAVTIFRP